MSPTRYETLEEESTREEGIREETTRAEEPAGVEKEDEKADEKGYGKGEEGTKGGVEAQEVHPKLPPLSNSLMLLLACTCFAVIGNLYYAQPLLILMGNDFHKDHSQLGIVTTCAQIGYAVGLLFITPLGDMAPRKKILVTLGVLVSGSLLLTGFSVSYIMLCVTSILMGMLTVMPQIIIPLAADLSDPKTQGKTIGTVMAGLLLGILLSRTISGWVGLWLGWRAIYWGACIVMLCTTLILFFALPSVPPSSTLTYFGLMKSLAHLVRTQPLLWQAGILGASVFGSFSCFWTTVTFRLSNPPYEYNSGVIGLFSLIGAAGVIGSPIGGFLADKKGNRFTQGIALACIYVSMVILTFLDHELPAMVVAMFFYDMCVQTSQVCNQQRIYRLLPKSKSRVNSIYMVTMFCGGALGSAVGSWAYGRWGWKGSCGVSLILLSIGVVAFFAFPAKYCGTVPKDSPIKEIDLEGATKGEKDREEIDEEMTTIPLEV